jgi:hypothetical protein
LGVVRCGAQQKRKKGKVRLGEACAQDSACRVVHYAHTLPRKGHFVNHL